MQNELKNSIKVFCEDRESFIYEVHGNFTTISLNEIEKQLNLEPETYFEKGNGLYLFTVKFDTGQQDEFGRYEALPFWDLDLIKFEA